jgi:hypothetical protein
MKLAIGMPWYDGPDVRTFAEYQDFFMYLGQLRERTILRKCIGRDRFNELLTSKVDDLPSLHEGADPTIEDYDKMGKLDIALIDYSGSSLVGRARDEIVFKAMEWGADYVFMWDADMRFEYNTLLRLWRHNVPIVSALAFTSRPPFHPVIMKILENPPINNNVTHSSTIVHDYPKNKLITNKDIGGAIAYGASVILINMNVFKQVPQPWFYSTGTGEDFHFCLRCHMHGVPRHIDTAIKVAHKRWDSDFIDEEYYERHIQNNRSMYDKEWPNDAVSFDLKSA